MESKLWIFFVGLAGLCWGVYVPLIAQGGKMLKNSYGSFLCVGIAYFLIAILFPLGVPPTVQTAGVAGALGALCVIFATFEYKGPRIYVAPVIFALAPVINTVVSLFWHPDQSTLHFGLPETSPHWTLYVGIILAGLGAGLVLYSKEASEATHAQAGKPPAVATAPTAPQ